MAEEKIIFNIRARTEELFENTPGVVYEGRSHRLYFAGELYNTYVRMYGAADFTQFWRSFYEIANYAIFPSANPLHAIICRRSDVDKKVIWAAINAKNDMGKSYEIADDEEGFDGYASAFSEASPGEDRPLPRRRRAAATAESKETKGPERRQPNRAALAGEGAETVKRAKTAAAESTKPGTAKCRSVYDNLGSSEDSPQRSSAKFRSPLMPGQARALKRDGFEDLKARIVQAFENGRIIPVSAFSSAMCQSGAGAFNFRAAACRIPKHPHSTLTKFLMCCGEILSIKMLRASYAILGTPAALELTQRRWRLFAVPASDRHFPYYVEVLCVNLLATRSTVYLADFLELFELIYATNFRLFVGRAPKDFISDVASPNLRVLNNKGAYSLVITPMSSPSYADWMPPGIWDSACKLEKRAVGDVELEEGRPQIAANVRLEQVFAGHTYSSRLADLMRIADLNLPKLVQEVSADVIPDELAYTPLWKILRHSVNFDDQRTFFL